MKKIGAAQFRAQCFALLDNLTVEGLIITKHGRPVARVVRYPRHSGELIGSLRGKLEVRGDVLSTNIDWDASAES